MIRMTNTQATTVLQVLREFASTNDTLDTIATQIDDQLNAPDYDTDLLDVLYRLLTSPKGKLMMSSSLLTRLRSAILSPREMAGVLAINETIACTNCGKTFDTYEMGTIAGQSVYCSGCSAPCLYACGRCKKSLAAPGLSRLLTKATKECGCEIKEQVAATPSPFRERSLDDSNLASSIDNFMVERMSTRTRTTSPATPQPNIITLRDSNEPR